MIDFGLDENGVDAHESERVQLGERRAIGPGATGQNKSTISL
jgi:hypothetical protein